MMNKTNIVIGGIAVVALVMSFIGGDTVIKEISNVGAISSPDINSEFLAVNGVQSWFKNQSMIKATTTLCAIQNKAATSTIESITVNISTGTTTAATIDIATSTTAFSTTTNLVSGFAVASGAKATFSWSPTGGAVQDNVIAPNEYIVVQTAGAGLSGYTYTGKCKAVLKEAI